MGRILRTLQAVDDVLEIWHRIAIEQRRVATADQLVRRFEEILKHLAEQPFVGTACDEYSPGLRCFTVGSFVLFFRPLPDGVRLIRVLHGSRNFEGLF